MALGYPHPDYLLRYLTEKQLQEWMIYASIEPFGEIRAELRAGQVTAMIGNTHLAAGARPMLPTDFVPDSYRLNDGRAAPVQTLDEQNRILDQMVAAGRVADRHREKKRDAD